MDPCNHEQEYGLIPEINYAQIHDSAENSCRNCGMLKKCILAVVQGKLPSVFRGQLNDAEGAQILDELVIRSRQREIRIKPFQRQETHLSMRIKGEWIDVELFRDPEEQPDFTVHDIGFKESAQLGPTTNSDMTLHNAKRWLDKCENEHPDCGKQTPGYYPTRLLDLRGCRVQLIETGQTNIEGPYVCLSHRWGIGQHFQSTVRNIQNHMKDIPYDTLPKTFQHAVLVCRRLGVNYLWIDSLCILQNSKDLSAEEKQETEMDFARENSAMANYYQNSRFTICANISTHMDSGMFSTEERSSSEIKVVDDDGKVAVFHIRGTTSHDKSPTDLEKRGWTFQEYLLPSRVLSFNPFDISWKCRVDFTCECGTIDGPDTRRVDLFQCSQDPPELKKDREKWWAEVVTFYTQRRLTEEQDKLPALSGLAQVAGRTFSGEYLAGIWETSLPYSLCWYYRRNPDTKSPDTKAEALSIGCRPEEYRAPSWSWASVDTSDRGECCFWSVDRDDLAHMGIVVRKACGRHKAACEPATSDKFGRVSYGRIELRAILITAYIDGDGKLKRKRQTKPKMGWTLSNVKEGSEGGSDVSSDVDLCFTDCSLGECGLDMGDEVKCAPILESFDLDKGDPKELFRACLVLKHLKDQEYQRIGFCVLRTKDPEWSYPVAKTKHRHSLRYTEARGHKIEIV